MSPPGCFGTTTVPPKASWVFVNGEDGRGKKGGVGGGGG